MLRDNIQHYFSTRTNKQYHMWKDDHFPIVLLSKFSEKSVDHVCVNQLLDSVPSMRG